MFRSFERRRLARELGMLLGLHDGARTVIDTENQHGVDTFYDPRPSLAEEIKVLEQNLLYQTVGRGRNRRRVADPKGIQVVTMLHQMHAKH